MIAKEFVLAHAFPALHYAISDLAQEPLKKKKGYVKNNEYIEYLRHNEPRDFAFVPYRELQQFVPGPKPIKLSKTLSHAYDIAADEIANIEIAVEEMSASAKKLFFELVFGANLIGFQIRLGKRLGTVASYSAGFGEHLVVFHEPDTIPEWVVINEETALLPIQEEVSSELSTEGACQLCRIDFRSVKLEQCPSCSILCHSFCMPSSKLGIFEARVWKCWRCTRCEGCGSSAWDKPYCLWNLKWIGFQCPDLPIGLCGDCVFRYKHAKDFCPICYKLYPSEEEYYARSLKPAASEVVDEVSNNDPRLNDGEAVSAAGAESRMDDESMVQCNECFRWVHSLCEGIDQAQYEAMTRGTHPVWGDEYLCPGCRVNIPKNVIDELSAEDVLGIFAEPVTKEVAENYFDVIRNPMDLSTMSQKASKAQYKSLQSLRQDFELMCNNALLFNKPGDEYFTASLAFFEKMEAYFETLQRQTHITAFGVEASAMVKEYRESLRQFAEVQQEVQLEEQRRRTEERIQERAERAAKLLARNRASDPPNTAAVATDTILPISSQVSEEVSSGAAEETQGDSASGNITLPQTLATIPDPACAFNAAAYALQAEDAFFLGCLDCCLVCGASRPELAFLFCIDCGEAFHAFCVDAPINSMSEAMRLRWRCTNCKICEVCGTASSEDEHATIYCDSCDRAFHLKCLEPIMQNVPDDYWLCADCVHCEGLEGMNCMRLGKPGLWGYAGNLCVGCQQSADEHSIPSIHCIACEKPVGDTFVTCRKCLSSTHRECLPYYYEDYIQGAYNDYLCCSCVKRFLSIPEVYSHVGLNSGPQWEILSKVAAIQRTEVLVARILRTKAVDMCRDLNERVWSKNLILLRAVIRCALNRLTYLHQANLHDKIKRALGTTAPTVKVKWLRDRALRFLDLFRDDETASRLRAEASYENTAWTVPEVRNLALLAAAFVYHTEIEIGGTDLDVQLVATARAIVKEFCSFNANVTAPDISAFMDCIRGETLVTTAQEQKEAESSTVDASLKPSAIAADATADSGAFDASIETSGQGIDQQPQALSDSHLSKLPSASSASHFGSNFTENSADLGHSTDKSPSEMETSNSAQVQSNPVDYGPSSTPPTTSLNTLGLGSAEDPLNESRARLQLRLDQDNNPTAESLLAANAEAFAHSIKLMIQTLLVPPVEVVVSENKSYSRNVIYNKGSAKSEAAAVSAEGKRKQDPEAYAPVDMRNGDGFFAKQQRSYQTAFDEISRTASRRISPLVGWTYGVMGPIVWRDPRLCSLCLGVEENSMHGRLIPCSDESFVHVNCMRWSSHVLELSGLLQNAADIKSISRCSICYLCGQKGASVGCLSKGCKRSFHLECAQAIGGKMSENRLCSEVEVEAHTVVALYVCPEHIPGGLRDQAMGYWSHLTISHDGVINVQRDTPAVPDLQRTREQFEPFEPYRCLKVDDLPLPDSEFLAHEISVRARAGRCGALTIHSLGKLSNA